MQGVESYLDITRLLVGIIILGYASYTDIKTSKKIVSSQIQDLTL